MRRLLLLFFMFQTCIVANAQMDRFREAVMLLDGSSQQKAIQGANILDSLVNRNCLSAIVELAKTYGWYSDSVSLRRKTMLSIEYYTEGRLKYMPVNNQDNDRARELFLKILESKDSADIDSKVDAAYRLATYYANDTYIKQDLQMAKKYLLQALEYANMGSDLAIRNKIAGFIKTIEELEKK